MEGEVPLCLQVLSFGFLPRILNRMFRLVV